MELLRSQTGVGEASEPEISASHPRERRQCRHSLKPGAQQDRSATTGSYQGSGILGICLSYAGVADPMLQTQAHLETTRWLSNQYSQLFIPRTVGANVSTRPASFYLHMLPAAFPAHVYGSTSSGSLTFLIPTLVECSLWWFFDRNNNARSTHEIVGAFFPLWMACCYRSLPGLTRKDRPGCILV